jgi:hypothetical protein
VPLGREVITQVEAPEAGARQGQPVAIKVYGTRWGGGLCIYEVPSFAIRVLAGNGLRMRRTKAHFHLFGVWRRGWAKSFTSPTSEIMVKVQNFSMPL